MEATKSSTGNRQAINEIANNHRKTELIRMRNAKIVQMFDRLSGINDGGVQKYTNEFILKKLEERFYVTAPVIMQIIKGSYAKK